MAAEKGDSEAQFILGDIYYYGVGLEPNKIEAIGCYETAAEMGNIDAQRTLGHMYYYGIEHNLTKASKWFEMAANQGDEESKRFLSEIKSKNK